MPIFKKTQSEPKDKASSTQEADDALLHAVRSILVGQERDRLKELEDKILSWKDEIEASDKESKDRIDNILDELNTLDKNSRENRFKSRANTSQIESLLRKSEETKEGLIERIAPVMADLVKRSVQDSPHEMGKILGPAIGSALRQQIRTEKDDLVDALYPVIGETITKSIIEALSEFTKNIDRRLRKRKPQEIITARLQGVSPGELFFRDNLPYQIQRVFLIHRNSGLLLTQVSASGEPNADLDIISGMLTAIRDFAKDSFGESGELNEIKHGDQLILLQTSQDIYVASVLNGTIPQGYNALLSLVVIEVNTKYEDELHNFDGDMDKLPPLQNELRPLLYPYDILKPAGLSRKQKRSTFIIILSFLLFLLLSTFYCIFTIRLWPYAFPSETPHPTATIVMPTATMTQTPHPTVTKTLTPTPTPTLRPDQGAAIGNLNIRSGPGTDNTVLDILYEGELFIILRESHGWLYIRHEAEGEDPLEGWVNALWVTR
ncbi:MAG: SH3 domain-containing protein [Chloroflexi bacterium]|nr:SH3 domain-containing protein [Chloroflexota bacterium]